MPTLSLPQPSLSRPDCLYGRCLTASMDDDTFMFIKVKAHTFFGQDGTHAGVHAGAAAAIQRPDPQYQCLHNSDIERTVHI